MNTLYNWREAICNYHKRCFTNVAVEGKNSLVKDLQHRHFFTRNPQQ
ncbi:transposase [Virgibacillus profundi]